MLGFDVRATMNSSPTVNNWQFGEFSSGRDVTPFVGLLTSNDVAVEFAENGKANGHARVENGNDTKLQMMASTSSGDFGRRSFSENGHHLSSSANSNGNGFYDFCTFVLNYAKTLDQNEATTSVHVHVSCTVHLPVAILKLPILDSTDSGEAKLGARSRDNARTQRIGIIGQTKAENERQQRL